MNEVCILIPTLNEEETIGEIIREFKSEGFENILVIDGNSTDSTREIAKREGAWVVVQRGKG
ncbi:MAG: glycosyltransferase, partial [Methanophagales archaeon]|nr:glycosyltransferase [Methanophagales archaeon]